MRVHRRILLLVLSVVASAALPAADITVFAAASLSDALKEIAVTYEPASGDKLVFNLGGSSALARQIREGAPADVFFSADEAKLNELAKVGLIENDTRRSLLSNTLVIVVNKEAGARITEPADLAKLTGRLALAEPQTVPAGIYAKEYLQKAGLWSQVAGKVVGTDNVRACLAAVEAGNADAGIVYKTDALISKKVTIAYEVPAADGPDISYPLVVVKGAKNPAAARKFVDFLASAPAKAVFRKHGFRVRGSSG